MRISRREGAVCKVCVCVWRKCGLWLCVLEHTEWIYVLYVALFASLTGSRLSGDRTIRVTWWWCNSHCISHSQLCGFLWKTVTHSFSPSFPSLALLAWLKAGEKMLFSTWLDFCGYKTLERNYFCLELPTRFLWLWCWNSLWSDAMMLAHPRQHFCTRNI